jgi:mRNA-degrading endonuclease YafQ of YafQ-DinJ toxin-antitoxin module
MISIELSKRFKKIVREAGREEEVSATLKLMLEGFGKPHAHSGLAIRKLGKNLYECRTGLAWRLIFEAEKGRLTFDFAGNHQEAQNYLRRKRSAGS